jgi:hypothetical protein
MLGLGGKATTRSARLKLLWTILGFLRALVVLTTDLPHKKWALVVGYMCIVERLSPPVFFVCGGDEAPLPHAPSTLFSVAVGWFVVWI